MGGVLLDTLRQTRQVHLLILWSGVLHAHIQHLRMYLTAWPGLGLEHSCTHNLLLVIRTHRHHGKSSSDLNSHATVDRALV